MKPRTLMSVITLFMLVVTATPIIAEEGPATLPVFGQYKRCLDQCGNMFAEYAKYYDSNNNPYWIYHPAWDLNLVESDNGKPVYAVADGTVILDLSNVSQNDDQNTGLKYRSNYWGVLLIHHNVDGNEFYSQYGHVDSIFVSNGQEVKKGNKVATISDVGSPNNYHLHWEIRMPDPPHDEPTDPGYWDINELDDETTVRSWYRDPLLYVSSLNVDYEASSNGLLDGEKVGSLDWWYDDGYGSTSEIYNADGTVKDCQVQYYDDNTWGNCAVVYDPLGGSRQAYTVRTGFWNNGQSNGWSQLDPDGPKSVLGMPITDEYAVSGGSRQDFQKGYMLYSGGSVSINSYTPPGWTSNGWNNQYSYLFARAYERNGGYNTLGNAQGNVSTYGPYLRQDFDDGSFGECCILYDPNGARGNRSATNEAYLLRSGFYDYYDGGGYSAYGCPSRDEYATGDPGDAIQFFVKRPGDGTTQQHHMYYDASASTITWNSTYATHWISQDPAAQFTMQQGANRQVTVRFRNESDFTWHNNPSSYPYDYVALMSVASNGVVTESFFNYPYDASLGWINTYTPCTMQESSVAPGDTATFTFNVKVQSSAALGVTQVYFRPYHSTGGLLDDWGGMNFHVNVVAPISGSNLDVFTGKFNGDNLSDLGLYNTVTGNWYVAECDTATHTFSFGSTPWLASWGASTTAFISLIGDFNGDGKTDIGLYEKSLGRFYVALNQGDSTFAQSGTYWLDNWGASATTYTPLTGDYNGDGKTDVCLYEKANGGWFVALSNGSAFVPSANGWLGSWGASATAYTPLAADYNGDGKTDVCLYEKAYGAWFVALSNGSSAFTPSANAWLSSWGASSTAFTPLTAWFSSDGRADVCLYEKSLGRWYVATSQTNSTFAQANGPDTNYSWLSGWAASSDGFMPLTGDFNNDSQTDICVLERAYGRWYVAVNQGNNSFAQVNGSEVNYSWLTGWGVVTGGGAKLASEDGDDIVHQLPNAFVLSQNYPNPFNPTTTISYSLPEATYVKIEIFNILGQRVETLLDSNQPAGNHSLTWDAHRYSSGIYFYRLQTEDAVETKKMLLLK